MTVNTNLTFLYESEYDQWLEQTINLLKENRFDELDKEHLIEELEELSRRDKKTVERLLEQIIRHLLLLEYWTAEYEYNSNHWQAEIMSFRTQLNEDLTQNLRHHLQENQAKVYEKALKYVRQKTGFEISFPEDCPYTLELLVDINWLPERG
jgi:NAD-specific glutamate dehydrogenase